MKTVLENILFLHLGFRHEAPALLLSPLYRLHPRDGDIQEASQISLKRLENAVFGSKDTAVFDLKQNPIIRIF